jgi:NAD(P) transhydrogenase subunit beta
MTGYVNIAYLLMAVLFILGIKKLSSPATARTGNRMAAVGMLIGIVVTLVVFDILNPILILIGIVVGAGVGGIIARTVAMTAMPQMVAILNGFGGGASELVASSELLRLTHAGGELPLNVVISVGLSTIIGGVTFSGSLIAFGKLQGIVTGRAVTFPMQKPFNALLALAMLVCFVLVVMNPTNMLYFGVLHALALVLGVMLVIPIGGADMPVVISLLNSYSGLAAATTGFVISNDGLIISGALVGASGLILTRLMCKAMNRSLGNVIFGAFGAEVAAVGGDGKGPARSVKQISVDRSQVACRGT